jgi:putative nucleotidyltransferase with HDIG domain
MTKIDLRLVDEVTDRLPSLPQPTLKALQLIDDPKYSASGLAEIIGVDQSLAGRLLQWANSPFYGLRYKVSTLERAIMVLGTRQIRELLMAVSVNEMLNRKMPGYGLERGDLWRHSVAVAAGSRWLAVEHEFSQPEQAFIGGLLHDIGKLVMDELLCYDESWQAEWGQLREEGASFVDLERWLTGFNHAELGARVAEKWNLPQSLVEAIAYHHQPEKASIQPMITHWIHLADATALMLGISLGFDGLSYQLSEASVEATKFQTLDLETLMQVELQAISDAEGIFFVTA